MQAMIVCQNCGALTIGQKRISFPPVKVDYECVNFHRLDRHTYCFINPILEADDFPVRGAGSRRAAVELITLKGIPTTQSALTKISQLGLRLPDRAEAETFLNTRPQAYEGGSAVALCGSMKERDGVMSIALVYEDSRGRCLYWSRLDGKWALDSHFLAIQP